ncbi:unnamed protein product [Ectocarpus sp. CCAP 1310/34]|nr:unnamed protein product [Ectocarpus sp. CCAP 1310/34]
MRWAPVPEGSGHDEPLLLPRRPPPLLRPSQDPRL